MQNQNIYARTVAVATQDVDTRARFIVRTYVHLFFAILGFVAIETVLFATGYAETIAVKMLSVNWLIVMGAFMLVGSLASRAAARATGPMQYVALAGFVAAEAVIFIPLLYIANHYAPGAIQSAAIVTLLAFTGLTALVVFTRKDFSFLGGLLKWGFIMAFVAIGAGLIFGFQLGTWFSGAMVGLAGYISRRRAS